MRLRAIWIAFVASTLLFGGCSFAGRLHFGDATLGLQHGFGAIGSHVGVFIH